MRTRGEWTDKILADLRMFWEHMDEQDCSPVSAPHARGMVEAGCRIILEKGDDLVLSDALSQAVLLLTLVRETAMEQEQREAVAS